MRVHSQTVFVLALLVLAPAGAAAEDPLAARCVQMASSRASETGGGQGGRLQVELDRAGGPRPERVREILMDRQWQTSTHWSSALIDACKNQLVRCEEFLPFLDDFVGRVSESSRKAAEHHVGLLRHEVALQRLSPDQRLRLYRQALRKGRATIEGREVSPPEVAERAVAESLSELAWDIRKWASKAQGWQGLERALWSLRILEARSARDPGAALIEIIERFAASDVEVAAEPEHKRPQEELDTMHSELQVAQMAIKALVALNPEGALTEMKGLFSRYWMLDPCHRVHRERLMTVDLDHAAFEQVMPPRDCKLRGLLVWPLIRAIGALGDRDFERRMQYLYHRHPLFGLSGLLWDSVHKTELELVKQGRMTEEQMVTRP